jgi:hypothetical protein
VEKRRAAVQHLTVPLRNSVRCLFLLSGNESESGVDVDAAVDLHALSFPSHVPLHAAKGYTLSLAMQVRAGRFDDVITTVERNVRLV